MRGVKIAKLKISIGVLKTYTYKIVNMYCEIRGIKRQVPELGLLI